LKWPRLAAFGWPPGDLHKNINTYVLEVIPLDDGHWDNGYWNIDVEATINEAQIEEVVNKFAKEKIQKKPESYLSFVFVARETNSVVKYNDTKKESGLLTDSYKENATGAQKESASEDSTSDESVLQNARSSRSNKLTTGESSSTKDRSYAYENTTAGSAEKKSDNISYKGYISEDIDNKVTEIFNKADFDVIPSFESGVNPKIFVSDFVSKDELSDGTKQAAVSAARAKGINYLAVGTLDVGEQLVDAATGLQKAYVRVNAFIWDLNGKFVKKVCSVGPVQYSGVGEDPRAAKTNALINAGTAAAKDLVDQLRVKQGL